MTVPPSPALSSSPMLPAVKLLLHGGEDRSLGGPTLRVPRTAIELRALGFNARAQHYMRGDEIAEDLVHLFNVWPPHSALQALQALKHAGKRAVFSPIYLDFSELPLWDGSSAKFETPEARQRYLHGRGRLFEIVPGYHAMVREMLDLADHVICLSSAERSALAAIGADLSDARCTLIHNPVDATAWQGGDPALFREAHTISGAYILCTGRIEPRKNQLRLAQAIRGLPLRLVLAGHVGDPAYAAQTRAAGAGQVIFAGRLDPAMLRAALAGARAFVLPSWAEGASLAALEAAAAGVPMLLSDRSSEREYFGDLTQYCPADSAEGLRAALDALLSDSGAVTRAAQLRAHVEARLDWHSHARATAAVYEKALDTAPRQAPRRAAPPAPPPDTILLDLTALTRPDTLPPHLHDCTHALATALLASPVAGVPTIRPVFWSAARQGFLDLPQPYLAPAQIARYAACAAADSACVPVAPSEGCALLVLGGVHGAESAHLRAIETVKIQTKAHLVALVEDVGPCLRPDLFSASQAADYVARLHQLADMADLLLAPSAETAAALRRFLAPAEAEIAALPFPALPAASEAEPPQALRVALGGAPFALLPGPLCARSNADLAIRLWARRLTEPESMPDLHLVIAGGVAPGGEPLADRIARDPRLRGRVHVAGRDRATRDWLWRNARLVLCLSESEAWDWPVTEARAHAVPCLVADIPQLATKDVQMPGLIALDPDDLPAWHSQITAFSAHNARQAAQMPVTSAWNDCASDLVAHLRTARPVRLSRPLHAGAFAAAGLEAAPLVMGFDANWHAPEHGLRRMAARRARFKLHADADLRRSATLLLHLHLHLPQDHPRAPLRLSCGAHVLMDAPICGASLPRDLLLALPADAIDSDGAVTLDLDFPSAQGLGVVTARFLDPARNNPLAGLQDPAFWSDGAQRLGVDFVTPAHCARVAPGLARAIGWGVGGRLPRLDFQLPLLPKAATRLLSATLRPVATAKAPSGARIFLNGHLLHEGQWHDDQPVTLDLPITPEMLNIGPAVMTVVPLSLCTPADLGLGDTTEIAGLGLLDLTLEPGIQRS